MQFFQKAYKILIFAGMLFGSFCFGIPPEMPMVIDYERSTSTRWLGKPVLESRLISDMESLESWTSNRGGQSNAQISLADEPAWSGEHSVCVQSSTKGKEPSEGVFGWGGATLSFGAEDWTSFNRLAFRVFPVFPGHRAVALTVALNNASGQRARNTHHFLLENEVWNHIVWEIPDLDRDQVTSVSFNYVMNGNEPDAAGEISYFIDHLELQRVDGDHYEGWNVAPGRIAFSHSGYRQDGPKIAIGSGHEEEKFQVLEHPSGALILEGEVNSIENRLGRFQELDFTSLTQPGLYALQCGDHKTEPFEISRNPWLSTIWKTVNFFYCERCGTAVPGVHDVCHEDWQGRRGDMKKVINGGWHDAGDLSQGLVNTAEATYSMFDLARELRQQKQDAELRSRLIEEAKWGLQWILETDFGEGFRINWATHRYWTDNRIGTVDDVTAEARYQPDGNLYAAKAEAVAWSVLKDAEPELARKALDQALEDWKYGRDGLLQQESRDIKVESAAVGVLAALELYEAVKDPSILDQAVAFASIITGAQQKAVLPGLDIPITGFFYRTPKKERMQHYLHRGHEQEPIVALARLCGALPDHPDWVEWYVTVVLHSEYYQKAMARLTMPYGHLPNSLHRYRSDEQNADIREQIRNGFKVGEDWYVRMYPVQPSYQFRGNYGTVLSQAKALSAAGRLRGDSDLIDLAEAQLQWVVGRNPFGQSTMFGEGHDYAPQYTARSGDMVGSLPVGMKSFHNRDLPYWPVTNVWNYKEVWVHPVSRWIWIVSDLLAPVESASSSEFTCTSSGDSIELRLEAADSGDYELRTYNLKNIEGSESRTADGSAGLRTWQATVSDPDTPWIAVAIPGDHVQQRRECHGYLPGRN